MLKNASMEEAAADENVLDTDITKVASEMALISLPSLRNRMV